MKLKISESKIRYRGEILGWPKNTSSFNVNKAFKAGELSTFQKQAVIKLIEEKDKDKRLIKNWRPFFLLNLDKKLVSKVLAEHLKTAIPYLISSNQKVYLNGSLILKEEV